jgi:hypothetical protein
VAGLTVTPPGCLRFRRSRDRSDLSDLSVMEAAND